MTQRQAIAQGLQFHGAAVRAYCYDTNYEGKKDYIDNKLAEIKKAGYKAVKVRATAAECGGSPFVEIYVEPKYEIDKAIASTKAAIAALPQRRLDAIAKVENDFHSRMVELAAQLDELEGR